MSRRRWTMIALPTPRGSLPRPAAPSDALRFREALAACQGQAIAGPLPEREAGHDRSA